MPSDVELLDLLTAKAMLLLRRERELFALRLERTRIELWIRVFHKLSLALNVKTPASLLDHWTELMVGELNFQLAAVYGPGQDPHTLVLQSSKSHVPLPANVAFDGEARGFMAEHPSGRYSPAGPHSLDRLAQVAGFSTFFWLRVAIRGQVLLLLCGYAPSSGISQNLSEYDFSHLEVAGKHLAALLENLELIAELDRERSGLAQSNAQLGEAMAQLRKEMSERLQLERGLRHAQKLEALGRMVAGIGHEINNPLAYVLSNLEFARSELAAMSSEVGDDRWLALQEALDEAAAGGERIKTIVSATREFSRPLEEPPRAVELHQSIAAAYRMVGNELRHRARFSQELETVPRVMADPHRLEQVFVNLLMNAVHAMPPDGLDNEIRVTCSRDQDFVVVKVIDNGKGLSESDLEHVFEPFFSTRSDGKGTGLGLWICRGIIESFGGRIELASKLNSGTTVSLHVRVAPSSAAAEQALRDSLQPQNRPARRPARILLIDDEPAVLRALARVLNGHEVQMTGDGRRGVELYKTGQYDVVFCDVMMPGFTGMDFVRELAGIGPEHARRVVMVTGGVVSDTIQAFLDQTGQACVFKPFQATELRRLVRDFVALGPDSVRGPSQSPAKKA